MRGSVHLHTYKGTDVAINLRAQPRPTTLRQSTRNVYMFYITICMYISVCVCSFVGACMCVLPCMLTRMWLGVISTCLAYIHNGCIARPTVNIKISFWWWIFEILCNFIAKLKRGETNICLTVFSTHVSVDARTFYHARICTLAHMPDTCKKTHTHTHTHTHSWLEFHNGVQCFDR